MTVSGSVLVVTRPSLAAWAANRPEGQVRQPGVVLEVADDVLDHGGGGRGRPPPRGALGTRTKVDVIDCRLDSRALASLAPRHVGGLTRRAGVAEPDTRRS
jgi:hypothetical protein